MNIRSSLTPTYRGAAMSLGPARRFAAWERYRRLAAEVDALGADLLVLDVGCGDGPVMRLLAPRHRLVGLDLDPVAVSAAARYGLAVVGDACALPFDDATFDVVVLGQALDKIPLEPAVREIGRVVRPGGRVILEVGTWFDVSLWPNLAYWAVRRRLPGRLRMTAPLRRDRWRTLRETLASHGLRVVRREGLEVSTGPFYDEARERRFAEVSRELPTLASQQLIVAERV